MLHTAVTTLEPDCPYVPPQCTRCDVLCSTVDLRATWAINKSAKDRFQLSVKYVNSA